MEPAGKPKFEMINAEQLFESPEEKQEKQNGMHFSSKVEFLICFHISFYIGNFE